MDFSAKFIDVPTHGGALGLLGVLESGISVPFDIKRVYFIHNVPPGVSRGSHGHKNLEQVIIPLVGSFDVVLNNGLVEQTFRLNDSTKGLYLRPGLWRNLINFSDDAVCLVLANQLFDEDDYIRDFDEFVIWATE